ncbi:MAG: Gfo/Idh/MocA family oxidoreductase [Rhodothermales bacterium]
MTNLPEAGNLSRRSFLKKSSLVPITTVLAGLRSEKARADAFADDVNVAVIGFGSWGREVAATLERIPEVRLAAIVDTYSVMLTRAERSFPDAATYEDYRAVLDDASISTVLIATPTHLHHQIAIEALDAGKHVYVEAPMASTVEDARAMARAARDATDQIYQVGLLSRSHPNYRSVFQFIRSGALGKATMARAQWHAKESWRRASPNREREIAQNWRLDSDVSTGLIGEIGTHQIDPAMWFLAARPVSVAGFGQIMLWDDGRNVPDTIQTVFEFDNDVHMLYDATLTSSFDAAYDVYNGRDSSIMFRDNRAWMFKEVDAPLLGWEVYARKDNFYKETGIALVADATQLDAQDVDPTEDDPNLETPLWYALREFIDNHAFGPYPPSAGYEEGYRAAVVAVKAHEATMNNERIEYDDALFEI